MLQGIATATGIGIGAIVAPRLLTRIPALSSLPPSGTDLLLAALVAVVVLSIVVVSDRLFQGRASPFLALGCAAALLSCVALPFLTQPPNRSLEPSGSPSFDGTPPATPHVLLLVLDTVRADHMSLYGYDRPTTPRLSAFLASREGTAVFPSIYSNSNWTVPSHASLFTGLLPADHGAHFSPDAQVQFSIGDHPTLAERMQDAGYFTIGVYANPWLGRVGGLARGFDVYGSPHVVTRTPILGEAARRAILPGAYPSVYHNVPRGRTVLRALEAEFRSCGDQPCFGFANLIDAHAFYAAETCRGKFADWSLREGVARLSIQDPPERTKHLMARYDEEICELDTILTELLEGLESEGILDHTWVFITSDHGEAFGDHGSTEHGNSVYNDQTWIPLIALPPMNERIEATGAPGSLIDLTATIAKIAGAEVPGIGRDLRESPSPDAMASIEFYGDPSKVESQNPLAAAPGRAVVIGTRKLVEQAGHTELFDLATDRNERQDLSSDLPEVTAELQTMLPVLRFDGGASPTNTEELSPEALKQLEELGYGR